MKTLLVLAILVALLVPAGLPALQDGDGEDEASGFMAAKGRVTFRVYCASCHGARATGDGNIAKYLKVPPADLTTIASRRDGVFPASEITAYIDGRRETRGHGSRDMPVWGDVFQSPLSDTEPGPDETSEQRVTRKLKELVRFLESIQKSD